MTDSNHTQVLALPLSRALLHMGLTGPDQFSQLPTHATSDGYLHVTLTPFQALHPHRVDCERILAWFPGLGLSLRTELSLLLFNSSN
jgi:hypothetical protein